jgi:hypothetical protein
MGFFPAREDTITTCPPRCTRWGRAARVSRKAAVRFVPRTASQSSSPEVREDPGRHCYQDLQAPEAVDGGSDGAGAGGRAAEVSGEGHTAGSDGLDLPDEGVELGSGPGDDGQPRALAGEGQRDRPADAPAGPGDECGRVADLHAASIERGQPDPAAVGRADRDIE